jgi:DNA-binding MltR family transcriptional regulator
MTPVDPTVEARMHRGNKMLDALKKETDRGKACVGDAMLDELFEELFSARFVDDEKVVEQALGGGQPLGSHGVRLKVAYLLGWIGPDTYDACRTIHKVRNTMAHSIEIDTFEDVAVRDFIDAAKPPQSLLINTKDGLQRVNLTSRADKFLITVMSAMMQLWQLIDESSHATPAKDLKLLPTPRRE